MRNSNLEVYLLGNPIQFDYTILATLFSLIFFIIPVHLMISAISFLKRKEAVEKEILQKLDELIELQTQHADQ